MGQGTPMDLLTPLTDWATAPGPPNYVFILALLTSPFLWGRYVKKFAKDQYDRYLGGSGA